MPEKIHYFKIGMRGDEEPEFQPQDSWRSMLNATFRNGKIETQKGNKYVCTIGDNGYRVIGWISNQNDKIIAISCDPSTGRGEIGIVYISMPVTVSYTSITPTPSPVCTYSPIYNHLDLALSVDHPISNEAIVFNEETSSLHRLYFSDRFTTPKVINLKDIRLNTYITSGNIVEGTSYMVLTGTVTYDAVVYGPGEVAGNVFTGTSTTTFSQSVSSNLIEEIPVKLLEWVPAITAGRIYVSGLQNSGDVKCGNYTFAYRLREKEGSETAYSYFTPSTHVGPEVIDSSNEESYIDYQGDEREVSSGKSIVITVEEIDENYDTIELIKISFSDTNVPEVAEIVLEEAINGTTMELVYEGNAPIGTIEDLEITALFTAFERIGTMATNKNYMMVGDVVLAEGIPGFDPSGVGIDPFIYNLPSDTIGYDNTGTIGAMVGHYAAGDTIGSGDVIPRSMYLVESAGGAGTITYNSVDYGPSESSSVFTGVHNISTFTVSGDALVYAVIRIQNFRGDYRYIKIQNDFYDGKGAIVSSNMMPYMRGETYRYGLLCWDLQKQPLFVKWLGDKTMPKIYDSSANWSLCGIDQTSGNDHDFYLRNLGVRIGTDAAPLDLTDIADKISGFSIVRARRKKRAVAQGLLYYCVKSDIGGLEDNRFHVEQWNKLYFDELWADAGNTTKNGFFGFYSPEYLFEHPEISLKTSNLKAELVDYLDDPAGGSSNNMRAMNIESAFYNKNYRSVTNSGGHNKGSSMTVQALKTVNSDSVDTVIDNSKPDEYFQYRMSGSAAAAAFDGEQDGRSGKVTILSSSDTNYFGDTDTSGVSYKRPFINLIDPSNDLVNYGDIHTTEYISCGHYQPINADVYAANGNSWIFKDIEVWGGDIYLGLVNFTKSVRDSVLELNHHTISFPVESNMNIHMRRGRHAFKDHAGDNGIGTITGIISPNGVDYGSPENFIIDGSYNNPETSIPYPSEPRNYTENNVVDKEIFFSQLKINGETIDNFRRFKANDSRPLELSDGSITALKRMQGRLFVWQTNGISYLPIGEAAVLSQEVGEQVLIGTSGVIERYDETTERYGLQDRFNLIKTKSGFAWIDQNRIELLFMSVGGQIISVSAIKGIRNLLESYFFNGDIANNEIEEFTTNPLSEKGLLSGYDEKNKVVYFTLHSPYRGSVTIGFDEINQAFIGYYSFLPTLYITHKSFLFSTPRYHYNVPSYGSIAYTYPIRSGIISADGSGEIYIYIANKAYTITPPIIPAVTGNTSLTKTVRPSDLHVHEFGDSCKYYGVVYDEHLQIVLNDEPYFQKLFKSIKINGLQEAISSGFSTKYSEIRCEIHEGSFSISDMSRAKFRKNSWEVALPMINKGKTRNRRKLKGKYCILTLTRDHQNGNITTSDNVSLKVISLISNFKMER